jgi:type II secretory pathway predicted ATPase ExeA
MLFHVSGLLQAFGNTSNGGYLFRSHAYADALRLLSSMPEDDRNIRLLIGDPGMGKTILLLHLLKEFGSSALIAHLFWTQLGRDEIRRYLLHELGLLEPPTTIAEAQEQLAKVLECEFEQNRRVIVAVDEAHNLEIPALQGLSELLEGSRARSKQMTVILAGLPQLAVNLASPEVQGISERIGGIASLAPLTLAETVSYINGKLEACGFHGGGPFTSSALATIATLAQGVPRNINNICFAVLYLAEKHGYDSIDSAMVLEATAQWEGRLTIATPERSARHHRISEEPYEQVSAPRPVEGTFEEVCELSSIQGGSPDYEAAALPFSIRQWFGDHRLAWSGTIGELAAVLDQPEIKVAHALYDNSEMLRSVGIAVSESPAVGWTRSIALRRLEPAWSRAERGTGRTLSECAIDRNHDYESESWAPDNAATNSQLHSANLQGEDQAGGSEPISAVDHALDLLQSAPLQYYDEPKPSSSRWLVLAFSIALAASIAWKYIPVLRTGHSGRTHQQLQVASDFDTLANTAAETAEQEDTKKSSEGSNPSAVENIPSANLRFSGRLFSNRAQSDSAPAALASGNHDAMQSIQEAALSGDPKAQFVLGSAYALGRGVPPDAVTGYVWLTLSFLHGNQQSESLVRELTPKLRTSEIARIRWNLGEMYANGAGVPRDNVAAYMWHLLAEYAGETRSTAAKSRLAAEMTEDEKSEASARASQWLRNHQK